MVAQKLFLALRKIPDSAVSPTDSVRPTDGRSEPVTQNRRDPTADREQRAARADGMRAYRTWSQPGARGSSRAAPGADAGAALQPLHRDVCLPQNAGHRHHRRPPLLGRSCALRPARKMPESGRAIRRQLSIDRPSFDPVCSHANWAPPPVAAHGVQRPCHGVDQDLLRVPVTERDGEDATIYRLTAAAGRPRMSR